MENLKMEGARAARPASLPDVRLFDGDKCGHAIRIVRPAGHWGIKGSYCLECGWRTFIHAGVVCWGDCRLPLEEVQALRLGLNMKPLK